MDECEVVCIECGEDFKLPATDLHLKSIYGICPHCGTEDYHEVVSAYDPW